MTAVNTHTEVTDALATEALAFRRKLSQRLVRYEGEFIALYEAASWATELMTRNWQNEFMSD